MSWALMLLVLFGAFLHAGWNAFIKGSTDKAVDTALVHTLAAAVAAPVALWLGPPAAAAWPYIGASLGIHIAYYALLVRAYQHGDLGLAYPVMRGCAPLMVALASAPLVGEALSAAAWLGVAGIGAGVLLLGLGQVGTQGLRQHKALGFALMNAAIIALYTVIDGLGVRAGTDPLAYLAWLVALDGFAFPLLLAWRRGAAGRAQAWQQVRRRWPWALLGGLASIGSYGIALWAMSRAPVAHVAALREVSVLFAALLGAWFLNERFGPARLLGTLCVVAGVMALRFAP